MSYRDVKVLVTGADGFIGSHLTEELVTQAAAVTALCLYNSFDSHGWLDDLPDDTRSKVNLVRGDLRDAAFVRRIVRDHEIIFHLGALIAIPQSYATSQAYVETNVLGTLNVLEAARDSNVRRVVHTSTSEVYGTAITMPIDETHPLQGQSPYSASKIGSDMMAEAFARSFDLPIVILRPFNTFGPRQSERAIIPTVIRQALDVNCSAIHVGDTTPVRDLTFVEDTVSAFLAIGKSSSIEFGRAYNAGSGKAVIIAELIETIIKLSHCEKPIVLDSERLRPVNSEVRALLSNSDRLARATNWRPQTPLHVGLERTIDWWRDRLDRHLVRREKRFVT